VRASLSPKKRPIIAVRMWYDSPVMFARLYSLLLLSLGLTACAPSVAERASRDIAAAFVRADFNAAQSAYTGSAFEYMAADPILQSEAIWFVHSMAYNFGYALGAGLMR